MLLLFHNHGNMKTDTALKALSALSHEARLAAFRELVQAGPDGLSVGELRELRDRLDLPAGAHAFLCKPVDADTLIDTIHPAINSRASPA